jgi:hypothetical protein
MGLFSVNMPLLYGEGSRAFMRLQDEIMKISDDQTIFAWAGSGTPAVKAAAYHTIELEEFNDAFYVRNAPDRFLTSEDLLYEHGLLADNPAAFLHSGGYVSWQHPSKNQVPYQMTNRGLSISLSLVPVGLSAKVLVADLQCTLGYDPDPKAEAFVGVFLFQTRPHLNQYARIRSDLLARYRTSKQHGPGSRAPRKLFIRQIRA